jgi:hypothetical protein
VQADKMRGFGTVWHTAKFNWRANRVGTESNRARRYPVQAYVEVDSVPPEKQIRERTTDLSLFGCHVKTMTPLTPGSEVSVQIAHAGENFGARGRVAYARAGNGHRFHGNSTQGSDRFGRLDRGFRIETIAAFCVRVFDPCRQ